jgi:hypothetical protein
MNKRYNYNNEISVGIVRSRTQTMEFSFSFNEIYKNQWSLLRSKQVPSMEASVICTSPLIQLQTSILQTLIDHKTGYVHHNINISDPNNIFHLLSRTLPTWQTLWRSNYCCHSTNVRKVIGSVPGTIFRYLCQCSYRVCCDFLGVRESLSFGNTFCRGNKKNSGGDTSGEYGTYFNAITLCLARHSLGRT